ncbi:hypothetical protein [Azospirillum argentinense]
MLASTLPAAACSARRPAAPESPGIRIWVGADGTPGRRVARQKIGPKDWMTVRFLRNDAPGLLLGVANGGRARRRAPD